MYNHFRYFLGNSVLKSAILSRSYPSLSIHDASYDANLCLHRSLLFIGTDCKVRFLKILQKSLYLQILKIVNIRWGPNTHGRFPTRTRTLPGPGHLRSRRSPRGELTGVGDVAQTVSPTAAARRWPESGDQILEFFLVGRTFGSDRNSRNANFRLRVQLDCHTVRA